MIDFRMDKQQYSLETENLVDLADIYILTDQMCLD